jgi:hypothetical protein
VKFKRSEWNALPTEQFEIYNFYPKHSSDYSSFQHSDPYAPPEPTDPEPIVHVAAPDPSLRYFYESTEIEDLGLVEGIIVVSDESELVKVFTRISLTGWIYVEDSEKPTEAELSSAFELAVDDLERYNFKPDEIDTSTPMEITPEMEAEAAAIMAKATEPIHAPDKYGYKDPIGPAIEVEWDVERMKYVPVVTTTPKAVESGGASPIAILMGLAMGGYLALR